MKTADKYIVAAFCVGLLFGVALGRFSARWFRHEWSGREQGFQRHLDRFSDKLGLSPDQKSKVGAILSARRDKMRALFADVGPKIEAIRGSTTADIRAVLTPGQQAEFDKFHAQHEAEWKKSELYHFIYDRSS